MFEIREEAAALALQRTEDLNLRLYTSFRKLGGALQKSRKSVTSCRIVRDADLQVAIQSRDRRIAFKELEKNASVICVVRLHEVSRFDHYVVVNATGAVIIDSEESMVLSLSANTLAKFGFENASNLRVFDV